MVNRSVVVRRRVRGLYRVFKKRLEVLKEGTVGVGVRGLRMGVLYRSVFASITSSKPY